MYAAIPNNDPSFVVDIDAMRAVSPMECDHAKDLILANLALANLIDAAYIKSGDEVGPFVEYGSPENLQELLKNEREAFDAISQHFQIPVDIITLETVPDEKLLQIAFAARQKLNRFSHAQRQEEDAP